MSRRGFAAGHAIVFGATPADADALAPHLPRRGRLSSRRRENKDTDVAALGCRRARLPRYRACSPSRRRARCSAARACCGRRARRGCRRRRTPLPAATTARRRPRARRRNRRPARRARATTATPRRRRRRRRCRRRRRAATLCESVSVCLGAVAWPRATATERPPNWGGARAGARVLVLALAVLRAGPRARRALRALLGASSVRPCSRGVVCAGHSAFEPPGCSRARAARQVVPPSRHAAAICWTAADARWTTRTWCSLRW